jgi:hypothetical protein
VKKKNRIALSLATGVLAGVTGSLSPAMAASSFQDVDPQAWYAPYVEKAAANHLLNGMGDGRFAPEALVTRAQFTAMMYNLLFAGEPLPSTCEFTDVEGWAAPFVQFAKNKGFISGIGDNRFAPDAPLTREQAAAVFLNALKAKYQLSDLKDVLPSTFSDVNEIAPGFRQNIALAVRLGILSGVGDNRFAPKQTMTRAEAATMIVRFFENRETYVNQWKQWLGETIGTTSSSGTTGSSSSGTSTSSTSTFSTGGGGGGGGASVSSDTQAPVLRGVTITVKDQGSTKTYAMDNSNTITLSGSENASITDVRINVSEDCTLKISYPSYYAGESKSLKAGDNSVNMFSVLNRLGVQDVSLGLVKGLQGSSFHVTGTLTDKSGNQREVTINFEIQTN